MKAKCRIKESLSTDTVATCEQIARYVTLGRIEICKVRHTQMQNS